MVRILPSAVRFNDSVAAMDEVLRWRTSSGTSTVTFDSETDCSCSRFGFGVSGSFRYWTISSEIFPLTYSSDFPWVAISNMGQDATNHLFSLVITTGKGIRTGMNKSDRHLSNYKSFVRERPQAFPVC